MFSSNKPADKLAAALAEYQRDFETRLEAKPNQDALEAQERINRANKLVKQSGLGDALLTVMEHTKDWPSWSQSADFKKWVGFPVEQVLAKEERKEGKHKSTNIVAVLFVYKGARYGVVFTDKGSSAMPDGDYFHSGTVEFVVNGEVVLGLDISMDRDEFSSTWRSFGVNALQMGSWSKALLEIAAYIRADDLQSQAKRNDEYAITKAKNIRL